MIDTHYDLLSICYVCYLKNDYSKIIEYSNEIKVSGVKKIIANLFFMSEEEMRNELHDNYYNKDVSILEMFKISKEILESYLSEIEFLYSIEGCDYLSINELDDLYNEGLRVILPVWNNTNIYGSGVRGNDGLTQEGKALINRAILLGIGIDLSHANDKTFFDIIDVIKENINNGKEVIALAGHSNSRRLCNIRRNLSDEELIALKSVNGYVGVLSNKHFVKCDENSTFKEKSTEYLKHIIYISNIIGIDKVMLSTDDMRYESDYDPDYLSVPIYDYKTIKNDIEKELLTYFNEEDTNKILYDNANLIIEKLKEKRHEKKL